MILCKQIERDNKKTNLTKRYKGQEVVERHGCSHPEELWHIEVRASEKILYDNRKTVCDDFNGIPLPAGQTLFLWFEQHPCSHVANWSDHQPTFGYRSYYRSSGWL